MVRPKSISERGRELALETSPGARALLAQVMADPSAPLAVAVVGPGGTGKSAVLDAVEDAYRGAGVDVVRLDARRRQLPSLDAAVVVLVDGAHRLEPAVLDELHALADSPDARVVVAYRPWPRSRGLSELVASLSRRRAPVVVGHLSRSAVKSRVAARLGSTPPDELVELVLEQSGGLPALADLVIQAMVDTGRFDPAHPGRFRRPDRINLSANSAERLRPQVEALDPAVHGLLEAMAVGAALDADMLCALLGTDPDDLVDVVEAGRAAGLLTDDGELIPLIRSLVLRLMPVLRSRTMQQPLAGLQLDRGFHPRRRSPAPGHWCVRQPRCRGAGGGCRRGSRAVRDPGCGPVRRSGRGGRRPQAAGRPARARRRARRRSRPGFVTR